MHPVVECPDHVNDHGLLSDCRQDDDLTRKKFDTMIFMYIIVSWMIYKDFAVMVGISPSMRICIA